jgi:broad specificity phosphatase PhoE
VPPQGRPFGVVVVVSHSVFLAMLVVEVNGRPLEKALEYDYRKPLVVEIN